MILLDSSSVMKLSALAHNFELVLASAGEEMAESDLEPWGARYAGTLLNLKVYQAMSTRKDGHRDSDQPSLQQGLVAKEVNSSDVLDACRIYICNEN